MQVSLGVHTLKQIVTFFSWFGCDRMYLVSIVLEITFCRAEKRASQVSAWRVRILDIRGWMPMRTVKLIPEELFKFPNTREPVLKYSKDKHSQRLLTWARACYNAPKVYRMRNIFQSLENTSEQLLFLTRHKSTLVESAGLETRWWTIESTCWWRQLSYQEIGGWDNLRYTSRTRHLLFICIIPLTHQIIHQSDWNNRIHCRLNY